MIFLYVLFFIVGVMSFFVTERLSLSLRLVIALVVFVVPSIAITFWILRVGDTAPPDAVTVLPNNTEGKQKIQEVPTNRTGKEQKDGQ